MTPSLPTYQRAIELLKKDCERLAFALSDAIAPYVMDGGSFVSAERQEAWLDALARHEALTRGNIIPDPEPITFIE
jgi:hypothetical protein